MNVKEKAELQGMLDDLRLYARLVSKAADRIECAIRYDEPSDPHFLPQRDLKISEHLHPYMRCGFIIDRKLTEIIENFGDEFIYN
jgi:hypothetical protein